MRRRYIRFVCPHDRCFDRFFSLRPEEYTEGEQTWCPFCSKPIILKDREAYIDPNSTPRWKHKSLPWHGNTIIAKGRHEAIH